MFLQQRSIATCAFIQSQQQSQAGRVLCFDFSRPTTPPSLFEARQTHCCSWGVPLVPRRSRGGRGGSPCLQGLEAQRPGEGRGKVQPAARPGASTAFFWGSGPWDPVAGHGRRIQGKRSRAGERGRLVAWEIHSSWGRIRKGAGAGPSGRKFRARCQPLGMVQPGTRWQRISSVEK